jgi:hypothetical protein
MWRGKEKAVGFLLSRDGHALATGKQAAMWLP